MTCESRSCFPLNFAVNCKSRLLSSPLLFSTSQRNATASLNNAGLCFSCPLLHRAIPDYSTAYPCHFRSVLIKAYPLQFHYFLCLALARLNYSFLCLSLSYPFFTLLFSAFALLFNALPSPFMSIHCHCLSYQILFESNHFVAYPLQIIILLFTALLFLCEPILCSAFAVSFQGITLHRFSVSVLQYLVCECTLARITPLS